MHVPVTSTHRSTCQVLVYIHVYMSYADLTEVSASTLHPNLGSNITPIFNEEIILHVKRRDVCILTCETRDGRVYDGSENCFSRNVFDLAASQIPWFQQVNHSQSFALNPSLVFILFM